jgi:hypothetical protein
VGSDEDRRAREGQALSLGELRVVAETQVVVEVDDIKGRLSAKPLVAEDRRRPAEGPPIELGIGRGQSGEADPVLGEEILPGTGFGLALRQRHQHHADIVSVFGQGQGERSHRRPDPTAVVRTAQLATGDAHSTRGNVGGAVQQLLKAGENLGGGWVGT